LTDAETHPLEAWRSLARWLAERIRRIEDACSLLLSARAGTTHLPWRRA
jgi:hypothetical protein